MILIEPTTKRIKIEVKENINFVYLFDRVAEKREEKRVKRFPFPLFIPGICLI